MRLLNRTEQDLCRRILNGEGNNNYLGNIIDHKLEGVRVSMTIKPLKIELLFTIQNNLPTDKEANIIIERINEISIEILTAVNLINILEKEGYILLFQSASKKVDSLVIGQGVENLPSIKSHFADEKIVQLLTDYIDKEIIVTEEFRRFCEHKFTARDEQRFSRQISITTSALVVAIAALLVNTFFNLLPKFTGGTKIKQEQVDTIRNELKMIRTHLDSINFQLKKNMKIDSEKPKYKDEPKGGKPEK